MPIRMTDDSENQQNDYNDDSGGGQRPVFPGGGGGGGSLFSLLPMLLGLFRGKNMLFLLLIGVGVWFFMRKSGGCSSAVSSLFSQSGYNFSAEQFNKASVYEGLEADNAKNPLPEAVSLLRFAPDRLNQGKQGSCVAWSSAYAARTILESSSTGVDPNSIRFSPAYMYNQIGLDGCQGSYIQKAMELMSSRGALPLNQFPYDDNDCSRQPNGSQVQQAGQYKIQGFTRLTDGDNVNSINVRAIKEHLSKDAPVVIGMMVGQSFMQDMMGQDLWQPQGMDAAQVGMGGHAMCVIGYDDRKYGGAFQIMNSWGPEWGKNGIAWVRYGDFKTYVREAYGIDKLPKSGSVAAIQLECNVGLVDNATRSYIKLKSTGGNAFQTVTPIKVGTRFKVEVKNATECYIYIFGQETNNSSYVLFPYLKQGETVSKHSPYCGITGYRLFPKAQSLEADAVGNKDYVAIVTSKQALDYTKLNTAISSSTQADYGSKVKEALSSSIATGASMSATGNGTIYFKANTTDNKVVAAIVAFDKVK